VNLFTRLLYHKIKASATSKARTTPPFAGVRAQGAFALPA